MVLDENSEIILKSFCLLEFTFLETLNDGLIYSQNYKHEFIAEMKILFEKLKSKGLTSLVAKPSKCNYCYPTGKAYSFHNPDNDKFIIRYVIYQESEKIFRIEECRNKPIQDGDDGMPF